MVFNLRSPGRMASAAVLVAAGVMGSLVVVAPNALAAGCSYHQVSSREAYASCSGEMNTGLVRVLVSVCTNGTCVPTNGPWVSQEGGGHSTVTSSPNSGVIKRGIGYQTMES